MDVPPPHPFRPPPPPPPALIPTRSTSLPKSKRSHKPTAMPSTITARSPTRSYSQSRRNTRSPSLEKHPSSGPPTWRAKFPNPLRRSNLKIGSTATVAEANPSKRWSAASTSSAQSARSDISNVSLASSTVECGKAEIIDIVRAPKPKIVDARSPMTTSAGGVVRRQATGQNKKLLEYWGVRQSDRQVVARQRASGGSGSGRVSAFREEFYSPEARKRAGSDATGIPRGGEKELPSPPNEGGGGRDGTVLSEGLMKWFRCDIFPSSEADFKAAETEAKHLVVDGGGTVMNAWTYPGGFMFQIPRNLSSPLPPTVPSATPTLAATILSAHLGETGSLRVTEFQPHLEPMQHLLQHTSVTSSCASTLAGDQVDSDEGGKEDLVSAIEYLTQPPPATVPTTTKVRAPSPLRSPPPSPPPSASISVEEIPLLRTSPARSKSHSTPQKSTRQRQSWHDSLSLSPETKGKLQAWLVKQQGSAQAKKRREGQVYGLSEGRSGRVLKKIEEVTEEDIKGEEEGEWVSDDGEDGDGNEGGSDAGSEFSVCTGLDSVRFVAECGSLF